MAGLREEGGGKKEAGLERRTGGVGGLRPHQASFYDGWRMFKKKKKTVDGGVATVQRNKRRGRLNKMIHH